MPPSPEEAVAARLDRFAATTTIRPRPDLHARVLDRLAHEPSTTAPRRFLSAMAALDGRGAWRAFRQSVSTVATARPTALAPRTTSLVRAQALVLVLVVTSTVALAGTVGGIGAAAGIASLLDGEGERIPQAPLESPSPEPTQEAPAVIGIETPQPIVIDRPSPLPTVRPSTRDVDGVEPRATDRASPPGDDASSSERDERDDRDEPDERDDRDDRDERDERDDPDERDERDD